ncbi:MAG: hypothetical protein ACLGI7_16810 [Gammaproteobacteria bacterium]
MPQLDQIARVVQARGVEARAGEYCFGVEALGLNNRQVMPDSDWSKYEAQQSMPGEW